MNNAFLGLFAAIIALGLIFFIFLVVFISCDVKWMRFISHLSWNLITIISVVLFILAGFFGLIGVALVYVGPLIQVAFSPDGLKTIFSNNDQMVKIMDTCMNKGGDLSSVLVSNNSLTTDLSNFINQTANIDKIINNVTSLNGSPFAQKMFDVYTSSENDISYDSNTDKDNPAAMLLKLTTYTDKNAPNTLQGSCSSNTYDSWVGNKINCNTDYTYLDGSKEADNINSKSCLTIPPWTGTKASTRYASSPKCSDINVATTASRYVSSLSQYSSDTKPILSDLKNEVKK